MTADAKREKWELTRRKTWSGFTGLTNRMIDSEAFQSLQSVHSVKVLIWFWQMAEYPKKKRKYGEESPIGNLKKILNVDDLSFEYRIAAYRGMRPDQFARALRELHKYGFIDILHHGRGIKGDWTKYAYTDRWKDYGTPRWQEVPFPKGDAVGWRSDEYKKRREREREKKNYYANAELSTTQKRSYEVVKTGNDYGNAELKTPISTDLSTTDSRSTSRSTKGSSGPDPSLKRLGRDRDRLRRPTNKTPKAMYCEPKDPPWAGTQEEYRELVANWGPI